MAEAAKETEACPGEGEGKAEEWSYAKPGKGAFGGGGGRTGGDAPGGSRRCLLLPNRPLHTALEERHSSALWLMDLQFGQSSMKMALTCLASHYLGDGCAGGSSFTMAHSRDWQVTAGWL